MNTLPKKPGLLLILGIALSFAAICQTVYHSGTFDIRLNGTSNLHDWEMKAAQGTSEATFVVNTSGQVTSLTSLKFSLPAANLKSGHSGMDKNTYKALNTDKNPTISFVLTSSSITATGGKIITSYTV